MSVKRDEISVRQWLVMVVTALVMPTVELLPTLTARLAGGVGWLSALGAIPLLLAVGWVAKRRDRMTETNAGGWLETTIYIMYMAWTLLLLMAVLRLSAARLERIYGKMTAALCAVAVLALAVWMALGKLSAFARAGEIFWLALVVLLGGVLVLAAFHVELSNFRAESGDWAALPKSAAAAAGILLNVYPLTILMGNVAPQRGNGRKKALWLAVFCVGGTLLLAAVTGCLGPGLTGKLSSPFQIVVQGLGIQGAFQRVEALVTSVLTLSDLMLMGALLHTWRATANDVWKGNWGRKSVVPAAAAALIGGWSFFWNVEVLWEFCSMILPLLGLILGFVGPVLVRCLLPERRKKR